MSMSAEVSYVGAENQIGLILSIDGSQLIDHTVISRAILELGRGSTLLSANPYITVDSSITPSYFDFSDASKLILLLGDAPIPKGPHNVNLTIFTPAYPNGLVFDTELRVTMR